jgi:RimJ/RimL family protein N-acetyltransferase
MLRLRPARPEDEDRLLTWRNEASTRQASLSSEEISEADHHRWLVRKLRDPDCALFIIEEAGRPLGQVRLDRIDPELAEISIGLAPEARGRGRGREALRLCVLEAPRLLGVSRIRALVKSDNTASLAAFRASGFRVAGETPGAIELLFEPPDESVMT